jgi:hypothetical protein
MDQPKHSISNQKMPGISSEKFCTKAIDDASAVGMKVTPDASAVGMKVTPGY